MTQPQGALLVGSVNFDDAETTMRTAAEVLGSRLKRIPDGEVGDRFHWIMFQPTQIARAEGIERVGDEPVWLRGIDVRPLRIASGVNAEHIVIGELGYADAALESYAVFTRLRGQGVIAPGTRFQVSLPTPTAVVGAYFSGEDRAAIEPAYRIALYRELDAILASIPHEDLAIQWDCAVEFAIIETHAFEGGFTAWWDDDLWDGLIARAAEAIGRVPSDVEAGVHLCYGDVAEKHFFEPVDTTNLVRFANALFAASPRPITWLHLPVPIERFDDAYFAPLDQLTRPAGTELYLGLVHREDGAAGAEKRIAIAQKHVAAFGVATECGIGRAPAGATEGVLQTHADVAAPW